MAEHKLITSLMQPFFRKGKSSSFSVPGAINDQSRILCIASTDLSEILFHIPLIRGIRRKYPGARIDFLVPEEQAPLIIPSGFAKECIIYKKGQLNPWRPSFASLLRKIGAINYDVSIVMSFQSNPQLELIGLASGAALRFGPSHSESWPAVNFELKSAMDGKAYFGHRTFGISPFLGLENQGVDVRWPLPMDKLRQVAQQIHFHKPNPDQMLVVIDPGLGKSGKGLALDYYQAIVRKLSQDLLCKFLPLNYGDKTDRLEKFDVLVPDIPGGIKREKLMDSILILAQCDLFIGGNTDLFHFAIAQGVPAIGIFSEKEDPAWIPPMGNKVQVITPTKEKNIDLDTILEIVKSVSGGLISTQSTIIPPDEVASQEKTGKVLTEKSGDND